MYTADYLTSNKAREDILNLLIDNKYNFDKKNLNLSNIPQKLYKYTSINKFSINDLLNSSLTATAPTEFNDLFDSAMHFDSKQSTLSEIQKINESARELNHKEVISKKISDLHLENAQRLDQYRFKYLIRDFRVACLSSNYKDVKMWSHYASNNKGICIPYNLLQHPYDLLKTFIP